MTKRNNIVGNWHRITRASMSVDDICCDVAAKLDCDAVESTFIDQNGEKYKNVQLLKSSTNGFIEACEPAWAEHYPLIIIIEPSHVGLVITHCKQLHYMLIRMQKQYAQNMLCIKEKKSLS